MAKSAIITLTTAGTDTGPFNLLSDVDSYVSPFESNIAKSSLIAGYTTNLVPDAATIIRVQSSSSLCTNYIDLVYPGQTTTTTTTTSTTTTTTTVLCECWTVVNEDVVTINYTYTDCDGTVSSPNLIAGGTRKHCIQAGSSFIVNSPIGGLLGEYNCAQACSGSPTECPDCTPTTTSTTTTTTTPEPTTTTSTTTTTTTPEPTTTTTTTTSTTTTTTTVFSCAQCKTWQYSSIPSGGDIVYYYSCIDGTLQSIGLSDTDPNGTFCNCNSVGNPFTSVTPGGTTLTELGTCDPFSTTTSTTTTTTTPTPTTTSTTTTTTTSEPEPVYNYYTLSPCAGGGGTDYRSILALQLGDVYAFQDSPPDRACYEVTSISATPNSNDLPTLYGPKLGGCLDDDCQQL